MYMCVQHDDDGCLLHADCVMSQPTTSSVSGHRCLAVIISMDLGGSNGTTYVVTCGPWLGRQATSAPPTESDHSFSYCCALLLGGFSFSFNHGRKAVPEVVEIVLGPHPSRDVGLSSLLQVVSEEDV